MRQAVNVDYIANDVVVLKDGPPEGTADRHRRRGRNVRHRSRQRRRRRTLTATLSAERRRVIPALDKPGGSQSARAQLTTSSYPHHSH